jgi:hypothetical protein
MSLPPSNACVKVKNLTPNSLPNTTENEDGCQGIILYIFIPDDSPNHDRLHRGW